MKKAIKVIALVLALAMVVAFAACGKKDGDGTTAAANTPANSDNPTPSDSDVKADYSKVKVGFILLHDPQDSTYDANFNEAALKVKEELGLTDDQVIIVSNVDETNNECYDKACELVEDDECNIIFGDSFGFGDKLLEAAKKYPDVTFCHATGTMAKGANLANYHNAFAAIYQGRYLAGVVAGLKIQQMITDGKVDANNVKVGYVGAFPYEEVKSGYTSWYLGVKSIVPQVTMEVKFTNSWFDPSAENTAAKALIDDGCCLISQHADSEGAPKACEEKGVPNVSYNKSTIDLGPTTALISSKINWVPYFRLMIDHVAKGTELPTDWTGTFADGSIELTELNAAVAAPGTQEKLDEVMAGLKDGSIHVFDTSKFTVEGKVLESFTVEGEETVKDGYFHESEVRSAPYLSFTVDGITAAE